MEALLNTLEDYADAANEAYNAAASTIGTKAVAQVCVDDGCMDVPWYAKFSSECRKCKQACAARGGQQGVCP